MHSRLGHPGGSAALHRCEASGLRGARDVLPRSGAAEHASGHFRSCDSRARTDPRALPQTGDGTGHLFPFLTRLPVDPESWIVGLMAGITLFGGAILTAMILLERPRCGPRCCSRFFAKSASRLRDWLEPKWPRRKLTEDWLQAEEDHARLRETASQQLEGRRGSAQPGGTLPRSHREKRAPTQNLRQGGPGPTGLGSGPTNSWVGSGTPAKSRPGHSRVFPHSMPDLGPLTLVGIGSMGTANGHAWGTLDPGRG